MLARGDSVQPFAFRGLCAWVVVDVGNVKLSFKLKPFHIRLQASSSSAPALQFRSELFLRTQSALTLVAYSITVERETPKDGLDDNDDVL